MKDQTIAFIGGGNMARSLIGGLIKDGFEAGRIIVSDIDEDQLDHMGRCFSVQTTSNNHEAVQKADTIVLAVKPQVLRSVAGQLAPEITGDKLVISIAAGVRLDDLVTWMDGHRAVVRAMPNTPSLVGSGVTGLVAEDGVDADQRSTAESILRAVGTTVWLENETQMDSLTAVSGSGPAYFFLIMESMEEAAVKLGLPAETARLLVLETAFGAAKMALEAEEEPAALRARVTSPGGTTERGIAALEDAGLREAFDKALNAARDRSAELAELLSKQ